MNSYDDHTSSQSQKRPSAGNRTAASARVKYEPHPGEEAGGIPGLAEAEAFIRQRKSERAQMEARLLSTAEEHKAAINQKLTAAEELEASKEELQQANEALLTLNGNLERKLDEINGINGDLLNLMNATEIGTMFLDGRLCINRYTPPVEDVFHIAAPDVGRPLAHLAHRLDSDTLPADAARVLREHVMIEQEMQHTASRQWFLVRLRPYHSVVEDEGVVITFVDITERKRYEEQLEALIGTLQELVTQRAEQIEQLTSELILSEQAERQRIAQLLHDDMQQLLLASQMKVGMLRRDLPDEQAVRLVQASTLIDRAIDVARNLTVELSPPALNGEDISVSLDWLVLRMEDMHNLRVEVESSGPVRLPPDVRILVYQLVRELLFNVVKHAGTDRARVKLVREENQLVAIVTDEGVGFDPAAEQDLRSARQGGFGLRNLRQRLGLLGGRLDVDTAPGHGTRMTLLVPLDRNASGIEEPPATRMQAPEPDR